MSLISTPAYVVDIAALRRNLECLAEIKRKVGCRILLATKAFSMFHFFPLISKSLDGTTASGIHEARLGKEKFGKEIHVYSPGYTDTEMEALLPIADYIGFNSLTQLKRFLPACKAAGKRVGVRINPDLPQVAASLFNPCSPTSRFGVRPADLDFVPWEDVDFIHIHALSDNMADKSVNLVRHIDENFGPFIRRVEEVNFGGGHYMTHPDYDREAFVDALCRFRDKYHVSLVLEPGGAVVFNAGFLAATVLDTLVNPAGRHMAILDTSAAYHMADVLNVPYRPIVRHAGEPGRKPYTYTLGSKTCLSGDVIGEYSFDAPLEPGVQLIFEDMLQYNPVKSAAFNGVPLPDIVALHENGCHEVLSRFGYEDFLSRLAGTPSGERRGQGLGRIF
jgi:carboxynorspermidine decarboxylase